MSASTSSSTTLTFSAPTPSGGWGFALGDVDAEAIVISATTTGGIPVTAAELGYQSSFNYCAVTPRPSGACPSGQSFTDTPTWIPSNATYGGAASLVGNTLDTYGAAGWFAPQVPLLSLTISSYRLSGFPSAQLWIATTTHSISGGATENGTNSQGLTITLKDGSGATIATTTTGANGSYDFGNLVAGNYQVSSSTPTSPGSWGTVLPQPLHIELTTADATNVDFPWLNPPPPTPTLPLSITPDPVEPGSTITIDGGGFTPGETVQAEVVINGDQQATTTGTADSGGSISLPVVIPAGVTGPADGVVVVSGQTSNLAGSGTFSIAAPSPTPTPTTTSTTSATLPKTGTGIGRASEYGLLLLASGVLLLTVRRRVRRVA